MTARIHRGGAGQWPLVLAMSLVLPLPVSGAILSGTYNGNGAATRVISSLGFPPAVVIIKANDSEVAVVRTASMTGDNTKPLVGNTALTSNLIKSLDADGFTVGSDARVNATGIDYYWVAFEEIAGVMKVGNYTGDGSGDRVISPLGFQPEFIIAMAATAQEAVYRSPASNSSFNFNAASGQGNLLTTPVPADGFRVGSDNRVNQSGTTYYYICWNEIAGSQDFGSYVGDATDDRNISLPGFQPEYLLIRDVSTSRDTNHRTASIPVGDESAVFKADVNKTDRIQALQVDGFQVGAQQSVNFSGDFYAYMAFAAAAPAESLVVDTTSDVSDGTTTSTNALIAAKGPDGKISLREAITATNNTGGANTIAFNIPVTDPNFANGVATITVGSALPVISDATGGTVIDGTSQTTNVGDTNGLGPEVEIYGAGLSVYGLSITSADNVIRGLIVNGFSPSAFAAVRINGAGATDNTVAGNYIGTNYSATSDVANYYGVLINGGAQSNTVGGTAAADRNIVSGNSETGILISGTATNLNVVKRNYIGLNRTGTSDLPNKNGVEIASNAQDNTVGGTGAADRNVVAGNSLQGIRVSGADSNTIAANFIGTNANATAALGNTRGVWLSAGAQSNTVGGTTVGERNVISGNLWGIVIGNAGTDANFVWGNYIGTDSTGVAALPNTSHGVQVQFGALDNTIGGASTGEANTIAFNLGDGIYISSATTDNNLVSGNSIFSNSELGIDLEPDGPGAGSGANNDKAAPVITSSTPAGPDFTIVSTVASGDVVEFYRVTNSASPVVSTDGSGFGEGYLFLGQCVDNGGACTGPHISPVADADPTAGVVSVMLLASGISSSDHVSATASDGVNGTSEFSANLPVQLADLQVAKTVDDGTPNEGQSITYTVIVTNNGPDTATNVDVTDALPAGVTYVSDTTTQGTYTSGTGIWDLGTIANAVSDTLTITATVDAGTGGTTIGNTASVTASDQVDDTPANDSDNVDITVQFTGPLVVDTTADSLDGDTSNLTSLVGDKGADGLISLREAIIAANNTAGPDSIQFDISDPLVGGAHTILVGSTGLGALPVIADTLVIDGASEPDYGSTPVVVLDGTQAGGGASGLRISAGGSTVRGLGIAQFDLNGIHITISGGNLVERNYIGTDVTGLLDGGNGAHGIHLDSDTGGNTIGGGTVAARNLISGNGANGVFLQASSSNIVQSNYIGADKNGAPNLGNDGHGILIDSGNDNAIGGTAVGERNVICGNLASGVAVRD